MGAPQFMRQETWSLIKSTIFEILYHSYLRWKELAHGIVNPLALSVLVLAVHGEVFYHLLAVAPKLVVENPVRDAEGEHQGEDVERL